MNVASNTRIAAGWRLPGVGSRGWVRQPLKWNVKSDLTFHLRGYGRGMPIPRATTPIPRSTTTRRAEGSA